jgi:hypothetical protein
VGLTAATIASSKKQLGHGLTWLSLQQVASQEGGEAFWPLSLLFGARHLRTGRVRLRFMFNRAALVCAGRSEPERPAALSERTTQRHVAPAEEGGNRQTWTAL